MKKNKKTKKVKGEIKSKGNKTRKITLTANIIIA